MAEAVLAEWKKRDPLLSDVDGFLRSFNKAYRKIEKQLEKDISRLVRALRAPIIVCPEGWHDTIPKWMKIEVTLQRLIQLMKGEEGVATDVEALVYLYTATLVAPFNETWPKGFGNPTLTEHQKDLLNHLKGWLWRQVDKAFAGVK